MCSSWRKQNHGCSFFWLSPQVAFQTEQYDVAKRACRELWSHYTFSDPHSTCDRLATTGWGGKYIRINTIKVKTFIFPFICLSHFTPFHWQCWRLHIQTLQRSSPLLCQLFLTSIFIETEINIQQGSLYCDSSSDKGLFIWEQVIDLCRE